MGCLKILVRYFGRARDIALVAVEEFELERGIPEQTQLISALAI